MKQSRIAHALLDASNGDAISHNEALKAVIHEHPDLAARIGEHAMRCSAQGCRVDYVHAPSSLRLEFVPITGERAEVLAIQLIAASTGAARVEREDADTRMQHQFKRALGAIAANAWMCTPTGEAFWAQQTLQSAIAHPQQPAGDAPACNASAMFHPDDLPAANKLFTQALHDGVARAFRYRVRRDDASYRWHQAQYAPIRGDDGSIAYWVGAGFDIQSFVESEESLIAQIEAQKAEHSNDKRLLRDANNLLASTQKMAVVSRLAGGVAHDLNNMLFIMGMNAELLYKNLQHPIFKDYADGIRANVKKAARLSSQLMGFSGRKPQSMAAVEPKKLMSELHDLLEKAVGAETSLAICVEEDAGTVLVDRMYLENSLINLAINARDAVAGRGSITLSIANERVRRGDVDRDYVTFRMHDDGMGMSQEVQERIFEPFFTTKAPDKGTGLGLPMVKNFVENSGGFLEVKTVENVGTTISIYLPRSNLCAAADSAAPAAVVEVGNESLLIIDDDSGVRNALANALHDAGYQNITTAYNSEYAIGFLSNGLKADVIISDVRMPGKMTTAQFLGKLQEIGADVPVIFVTGYSEDVVIEHGLVDGRHPVLFKPYTLEELFASIRDCVKKPSKAASTLSTA
ncbi:PAS domain-containing hybrid sensor histidine kinase/response regulator [Diaphorobacter aerolatus]|uniref:histidine kinase n=1 Tax=Diaphorobacter aerolatus TaxID=1288495 RepID=A0A7H0GMW7_9BURK|nr:hybrid sensor histidine kinase/response regulator [Diaphorobacter aerolatus]QNP49633.1 response regulator [Diaphorobacter aerolatus]